MTINLKLLSKEWFEEVNSREPKYNISIGRSSIKKPNTAEVYRFSSGVVNKCQLNNFTHCKLAFNKQYQVIYFRFLKADDQQSIPPGYLRITKDKKIRKITAVSFARHWDINNDQYAGTYPYHEINKSSEGLELAINLSEKLNSK